MLRDQFKPTVPLTNIYHLRGSYPRLVDVRTLPREDNVFGSSHELLLYFLSHPAVHTCTRRRKPIQLVNWISKCGVNRGGSSRWVTPAGRYLNESRGKFSFEAIPSKQPFVLCFLISQPVHASHALPLLGETTADGRISGVTRRVTTPRSTSIPHEVGTDWPSARIRGFEEATRSRKCGTWGLSFPMVWETGGQASRGQA